MHVPIFYYPTQFGDQNDLVITLNGDQKDSSTQRILATKLFGHHRFGNQKILITKLAMIESTMHLKGNPSENDFFLASVLMDKIEESKWTLM